MWQIAPCSRQASGNSGVPPEMLMRLPPMQVGLAQPGPTFHDLSGVTTMAPVLNRADRQLVRKALRSTSTASSEASAARR